jgi:hypothetical protein
MWDRAAADGELSCAIDQGQEGWPKRRNGSSFQQLAFKFERRRKSLSSHRARASNY